MKSADIRPNMAATTPSQSRLVMTQTTTPTTPPAANAPKRCPSTRRNTPATTGKATSNKTTKFSQSTSAAPEV
jgi:hypothetical protein